MESLKSTSAILAPINTVAIIGTATYFHKQNKLIKDDMGKLNKHIDDISKGLSSIVPQLRTGISASRTEYSSEIKKVKKDIKRTENKCDEIMEQMELLINALIVKKLITKEDITGIPEEEKFVFQSKTSSSKKVKAKKVEIEDIEDLDENPEEIEITPINKKTRPSQRLDENEDVNELFSRITGLS